MSDISDRYDLDANEWRQVPNVPLDDVHTESLTAIALTRRDFHNARRRAATWTPAPMGGA